MTKQKKNKLPGLKDLLKDEKSNGLSEYLFLSFKNLGKNTQVSVSTVEDSPIIYSEILVGVSLSGLAYLGKS